MTVQDRDLWRLGHILDAIENIEAFKIGLESDEDFIVDSLKRAAIERQLIIIGEASSHLSPEIKERSSETDWKKVKGLRNILAHEYFAVDPIEVWGIVQNRIPELKPVIKRLIVNLKKEK